MGSYLRFGQIIAKDNLNIANLMQIFENLLLQNYLKEFLEYCTQKVFGYVLLKFFSNGGATAIFSELIAKLI